MPQMSGDALARALRQIRPDLPLILCTGYSHVIDANEALSQGINAFLLKPIGLQNLAATIQEVLKVRRN